MGGHSRHVLHHVRRVMGRDPDMFTRGVFTRLFALDPDLRDLFPAHMTHLREAFFGVIDHTLEVIPADDGHTELVEILAQLGRDHRKFGVLPAHYPLMCRALIGEFRELLDGYWDDETEQTVTQAMMLTTGVMRGAAEMASGPPTWTARVVEKYRITRDLAVVRLIGDGPLRFSVGQFLEVAIPQWPHEWRHLSPAIPPNPDGEIEFHVRAIPGGVVSSAIVSTTRVGDVWTLAQNHGTLHIAPGREVLMVAGGTGLAPLRALLIEMSKRADSPSTHVFYGMRYPGELYDLAVLQRIASTNPWLRITAVSQETTDPWWLNSIASPEELGVDHRIGMLPEVVAAERDWSDHQALVVGSPQMVTATRRRLIIAGIRASMIQSDPVY
ncbi:globin domain-containing protein [Gordonia otitidis]|uniref:FAD-binding oxidoreductase n=1 Tax=Gordonia otitidis TaxID=249058 RepID=UPI001D14382E|nr:FAD-binding oxidoreductase [Gordonia otitidis]UEA57368.1 globin domain-containing protein [Gordonia otitidis]